jgi:hypothetical protein
MSQTKQTQPAAAVAAAPTEPPARPVLDRTEAAKLLAWQYGETMDERERNYYMRRGGDGHV